MTKIEILKAFQEITKVLEYKKHLSDEATTCLINLGIDSYSANERLYKIILKNLQELSRVNNNIILELKRMSNEID